MSKIDSKLATAIVKAIEQRSSKGYSAPAGKTVQYAVELDDAQFDAAMKNKAWRNSPSDISDAAAKATPNEHY